MREPEDTCNTASARQSSCMHFHEHSKVRPGAKTPAGVRRHEGVARRRGDVQGCVAFGAQEAEEDGNRKIR
eukprot:15456332-Alexandrium_andersonii.AAC.1